MERWKRRLLWVTALLVAAVPWWGPVALRPLAFFAVRHVEVAGVRYLPVDTVVRAMGLGAGASVWEDRGTLERRLLATPGIAEVHVERELPATLRVTVREVEPVALAEGPAGLVPLGADGRPLPYDPASAPVDAPVLERLDTVVLAALARIQATDPGLFAAVSAARTVRGGSVELDLREGVVRLGSPVELEVVRSVSAVRRDLESRSVPWRELDARFKGWVIVRPRAVAVPGGAA